MLRLIFRFRLYALMQAKAHGLAGKDHAKAGAEEKKEGHKAASDARKDAAKSEYHEQK